MKIIGFFLKNILAVAIGCFLSLLGLLIVTFLSKITFENEKVLVRKEVIKNNSVLELNLQGTMVEIAHPDLLGRSNKKVDFNMVRQTIQHAVTDNRIQAIFLNKSDSYISKANIEELRSNLLQFKNQGKAIVAYADTYNQQAYYLASVADEIVLNPNGVLCFQGFSATIKFGKKLLEKVGVQPTVYRIGSLQRCVRVCSIAYGERRK